MEARKARPGMRVTTDEGQSGHILNVSDDTHQNIYGVKYRWALVDTGHHKSVWPTNRLH